MRALRASLPIAMALGIIAASGLVPPAVRAATPTTIAMAPGQMTVPPGEFLQVGANLSPAIDNKIVTFYRRDGADAISLGSDSTSYGFAVVTWPPDLPVGSYQVFATFDGTADLEASTSEDVTITVGPIATKTILQVFSPRGGSTAYLHDQIALQVSIQPDEYIANGFFGTQAPVSYEATSGDITVDLGTTGVEGVSIDSAVLGVGSWDITASYGGNAWWQPSTSEPVHLDVVDDVVEASGVGLEYGTFYPKRDGYRDTVAIRGQRSEAVGVSIRIYSPAGTRIKTITMAADTGPYRYRWDGRRQDGSLRPAGTYRVVQVLTDGAGTKVTFTSYVKLSWKRLVYRTTYVSRAGSSITVKGRTGAGRVTISTSGGYAKLKVMDLGWAGVGYQFTLPSAVRYSAIAFQAYIKGPMWTGVNQIGVQDFSVCAYDGSADWSMGCFHHWRYVGTASGGPIWYASKASPTIDRSGRKVRGAFSVEAGTFVVYRVRVKVTYGVLR